MDTVMCRDAHLPENRDQKVSFSSGNYRTMDIDADDILIEIPDDLDTPKPLSRSESSARLQQQSREAVAHDPVEAAIKDVVNQMMDEYAISDKSEIKRKSSYANLKAAEKEAAWKKKPAEKDGNSTSRSDMDIDDEENGARAFFRVHSALGLKSLALPLTQL